jgi:hypothetical protein
VSLKLGLSPHREEYWRCNHYSFEAVILIYAHIINCSTEEISIFWRGRVMSGWTIKTSMSGFLVTTICLKLCLKEWKLGNADRPTSDPSAIDYVHLFLEQQEFIIALHLPNLEFI